MKKIIFLLVLILLTPQHIYAEADKLRGVWVSTVANLDYPSVPTTDASALRSQADSILDECLNLGMNAVFLQVRPSSDAIYPSKLYPYSAYLTGNQGTSPSDKLDPLAYWIDGAHSRGMQLHAWINPYRVSTDANVVLSPDNPAKKHPDWVITYRNALYFDPGIPEAKEYVINGIKEIVENYDVDGIHFDDYFYPGSDFDDSASYSKYGKNADKADWRRSNTNALIRETGEAIRSSGKNIRFGVSPSGIWANKGTMENGSNTTGASAYFDMYADTLKWAKENYVDYIAPQIYWYNGFKAADYKTLCEWWQNELKDSKTDLYIGLADYRLDSFANDSSSPWYDGNEILKQMQLNSAADGIDGEIHFRYNSIIAHKPLYDKIKAEYSADVPDTSVQSCNECVYIYYDKFGNPVYIKKVSGEFDIKLCRSNAPDNAEYADCVFFTGKWHHERVCI